MHQTDPRNHNTTPQSSQHHLNHYLVANWANSYDLHFDYDFFLRSRHLREEKPAEPAKSNGLTLPGNHKLQKAAKKLQRINSMRRRPTRHRSKEEKAMLEEKKKVQHRRNMELRYPEGAEIFRS